MAIDLRALLAQALECQGPLVAVVGPSPPPSGAVYNYDPKVMIVAAGRHRVIHADGACPVPPGGFVIYRPGSWHLTTDTGPRRYASLILSADRLRFFARVQSAREGPGETRIELRPRPADPVLEHLLAALAACAADSPALPELGRALLRHCLPRLAEPDPPGSASWQSVRAFVETYVHRPLSREQIANACGISPGHLSALCRQQTGRRFIDVLTEARMRHAEHLLRERAMTVAAVAQALGYADLRHFRRVFKRAMGVAPGALR